MTLKESVFADMVTEQWGRARWGKRPHIPDPAKVTGDSKAETCTTSESNKGRDPGMVPIRMLF
jgi:hypothetical protein